MSTVKQLLTRGTCTAYRRLEMKRVKIGGGYESDWYDITPYVVSWGQIGRQQGDKEYLGTFEDDGLDIVFDNSSRKFNAENDPASLFWKYASLFGTKFKVTLGCIDDDYSEVSCMSYYGITYTPPQTSSDGTSKLSIAPMIKTLDWFPASLVADTSAGTSEQIVGRLLAATKNGVSLFDRYFEGTTQADKYKINTANLSTITVSTPEFAEDETILDILKRHSLYNDFTFYVNNDGAFVWERKQATSNFAWKFYGGTVSDADYGVSIVSVEEDRYDYDQVWTRFVIEYEDKLYSISAFAWTPGDGSFPDVYGEKTWSQKYEELSQSEAQTIVDSLRPLYSQIRNTKIIQTVFIPHLMINDKVELTYLSVQSHANVFKLNQSKLDGGDVLGGRIGSVSVRKQTMRVVGQKIDVDNGLCTYTLRDI